MFEDRREAGHKLAEKLAGYRDQPAVVVALPRGGVVLGREIAQALRLPLDLVVPRKIGAPGNPEYAIGAITETGHVFWNEAERSRTEPAYLEEATHKEKEEAGRRLKLFRGSRPERDWAGLTAIVVDDGIATGYTMRAALQTVRSFNPDKVVLAVPVGPSDVIEDLRPEADDLVVISRPLLFGAVGAHYRDFQQVSDDEVVKIMSQGV